MNIDRTGVSGRSPTQGSTSNPPKGPAVPAFINSTFLKSVQKATQLSFFDDDLNEFSHEKVGGVFNQNNLQPASCSKVGQAIAVGAIHRSLLYPLELITTRMVLDDSSKGNYFRGLPTSVATGAIGKAASLGSNKVVRDCLETSNVQGASLIGGVAAGAVESALNPLNVISQQAKMLPGNQVIPALKKMSLASYYNGGLALIAKNVLGAAIWYHGNTVVRNKEDSLGVEAGKSAGVSAVASAASWPAHVMHIQRIGVNGVSPSYGEIVKTAFRKGLVWGLKLRAYFPTGLLRVVLSGAILGPLMNRFNEGK